MKDSGLSKLKVDPTLKITVGNNCGILQCTTSRSAVNSMGDYNFTFRSDTTFHNLYLEYDIWKFQVNQTGLQLNGTQQLLVYTDDVNLVADNMDTIKENTETSTVASKGVGLDVNAEKIIVTLPQCRVCKIVT